MVMRDILISLTYELVTGLRGIEESILSFHHTVILLLCIACSDNNVRLYQLQYSESELKTLACY